MAYRAVAALVAVFALALTAGLAWFVYRTPGNVFSEEQERTIAPLKTEGEPVTITVKPGESAKAIGADLEKKGVIRSKRLFEILVGVTGVQKSLEAGDYEFDPGLPAIEVVHRIAQGKTASRTIVIPEGRRAEEIGDILEKAGLITKQQFLDALVKSKHSEAFLQQIELSSLEGFLFPAKYELSRSTTPDLVVDTLLRGFQTNVADKLQLEGQSLTLQEVVTLASIVEREAATPSERPIIASVFLNRIRLGLPLQADPTVQYAITEDLENVRQFGYWKEGLTLDDLKFDSPYNTYVVNGLPRGPIANPGLSAIEAVVRPATTNYLFFVAKDDGTHVFAETLDEHLRNVQKYQQ